MRNLALSVMLVVGVIWTAIVTILWLYVGGWEIASLKEGLVSILGSLAMFAPPVILVCGSLLGFIKVAPRLSVLCCILGSVCLSVGVAGSLRDQSHLNSAQTRSSPLYLGALVASALLCDVSSLLVARNWNTTMRARSV